MRLSRSETSRSRLRYLETGGSPRHGGWVSKG